MSWIFGCLSENLKESDSHHFQSIHGNAFQLIKKTSFYLAVGENKYTTFASNDFQKINDELKGWVVSGVGLVSKGQDQKVMSAGDWAKFLESYPFDASKIDGHFIVIIWENDKSIKIYNDLIGFRTVYLKRQEHRIIFSTELAWITKLVNQSSINLEVFGSRWLTFNQLSHGCLINGIEKLGPGSKIEIENKRVNVESRNWLPLKTESTEESFSNHLKTFLFPQSNSNYPTTLGLSGGLDSRTLLALASINKNKKYNENFRVHSFGSTTDADYLIASQICNKMGVEHTLLSTDVTYDEKFISQLSNYSKDALLVEPVASFMKNIYFDDKYFTNKIVIDGANGEIARRQFYNRLFLKGKNDLMTRNAKNILGHLTINRSDIFLPEVLTEMKKGCLKDVTNLFELLPAVEEIGIEKFVDLMAIKFRFPNYFGPEQSRLDKKILSYMPFSQISVLEKVICLPEAEKRNSKLFYKLIEENNPILKNFPLVKNGITYPYGLYSLSAFIYTKLKRKLVEKRTFDPTYIFYQSIKEYVNETFLNVEVQSFPLYNHKKIKQIIESYYRGDKSVQSQLDWWFTFELWRRNLSLS